MIHSDRYRLDPLKQSKTVTAHSVINKTSNEFLETSGSSAVRAYFM